MATDDLADLPLPANAFEQRIVDDVARFGWHVVLVRRFHEDDRPAASVGTLATAAYAANFSYTVGLRHTFAHPEIVLVGDWQYSRDLLNVAGDLVKEGSRFAPGDLTGEVLEGLEVRFASVDEAARLDCLTFADWAARRRPFAALQLLLPDAEGRWPDNPRYASKPQPLLA